MVNGLVTRPDAETDIDIHDHYYSSNKYCEHAMQTEVQVQYFPAICFKNTFTVYSGPHL